MRAVAAARDALTACPGQCLRRARATRRQNSTMCVERCPPYTRGLGSTRGAQVTSGIRPWLERARASDWLGMRDGAGWIRPAFAEPARDAPGANGSGMARSPRDGDVYTTRGPLDLLQRATRAAVSIEFLVTSLIVVATPGTGVLYTLAAGLSRGIRASIVAAFSCTLGIIPHMAAAILGLAALLHTSALAFHTLKYLGVAYLLYMAWSAWRERGALSVEG